MSPSHVGDNEELSCLKASPPALVDKSKAALDPNKSCIGAEGAAAAGIAAMLVASAFNAFVRATACAGSIIAVAEEGLVVVERCN